ncbi:mitochondrial E3 ubiquitin protein ligase 1 [Phymastichus coffea]|uniref:mitochondrial E3 ubiquitin protein ligase 1 n=1 Tax=Phymastichus coffea TaxID=108790 RepID=UPI00273B4CEE|nr:mitochondrial E3 ubiquitin protein ligase 1 [Phymastichus coffea]XP_058797912.1 mitochondrial E3 ubiquitin protein ligase 1 [Phymastichus coffea]
MDYLGQFIALGIDGLIFGICMKQYFYCKNSINAVKNVEFHEVGDNLSELIEKSADNKIDYIAIRGAVKPIGEPIRSINNKDITGVVQKLSVKEHVVVWTTSGYWSDQEHTMQEVYNSVPFVLEKGKNQIEIVDAMAADILDLETISDFFEPSAPTFVDYLWGFFTGQRQRGLQSTEEMLREGSIITGIGELSKSQSKAESLVLQPPVNGTPYYLTTMSLSSLLRKLDDKRKIYRWLCLMFGAIGLFIGGIALKRYLKDKEEQRLQNELQKSLEDTRKERRQRVRDRELREDQICVICCTNPREIILLPCGHVCLCEDCSIHVTSNCPVCRKNITQKSAAYIA